MANTPKEKDWRGYYDYYLRRARDERAHPLEVMDAEWEDGHESAARYVLPHIDPSSRVLEIACGIGRVSRRVAPYCAELVCTDILQEALDKAKQLLAEHPNVKLQKIDGYELAGFEASSFDCVYSFTAFFHFDWELVVAYFGEIARVLRAGGMGVIELKAFNQDAHFDQLATKIVRVGNLQKYEAKLDKWRYVSRDMLELVCARNGLEIIDPTIEHFTFRKRAPR